MHGMARVARSVLILDHHKTAEAALAKWTKPFNFTPPELGEIICHFDQNLSGAGLAWKYFFPTDPVPRMVEHVQDRDLWRFELPGTREICAALYAQEFEFEKWEHLATTGREHTPAAAQH